MTTPTTPATDVKRWIAQAAEPSMLEPGYARVWVVAASAFDALAAENERLRKRADEIYATGLAASNRADDNEHALAAATAEVGRLRAALDDARRNAYIRGFQRGYDKKAEIVAEGPQEYERVRAWAEAHANSYCDQFDDSAPSPTSSDVSNSYGGPRGE